VRRLSALVVVVLLALAPLAQAAPSHGPVQKWAQAKIAAVRKTWSDPAERKHAIGKGAVWLGSLGVGQVIDMALMAHGVPPIVSLSAGFVSSAAPTLAQYPAQQALSRWKPALFEPPEHRSGWELTKDAVFSGAVGVGGGALVSAVGAKVSASVPVQKLMMPVVRAGMKSSRGLTNLVQWGTSQYANQKVSDASDKAREHAGRLGDHLRKKLIAAQ
jgi:hypothetical protein